MLRKDFENFKSFPHHFEYTSSIFRQGDLSRNSHYQSFYRLTFFLMSLKSSHGDAPVLEGSRGDESKRIVSGVSHREESLDVLNVKERHMRVSVSKRYFTSISA